MKTRNLFIFAGITCILLASCYKEYTNPVKPTEESVPPMEITKYGSLKEFYTANEMKSQSFPVNAASGGTYLAAQGTQITIPSNAFVTQSGDPVTGNVSLEFKEIYKKSDMVLSAKPTIQFDGRPLKSGGEFFARATYNGEAVQLAPGKIITIEPALFGLPPDPDMEAFTAQLNPFAWIPAGNAWIDDSVAFMLFVSQFLEPEDSGTWYNCDNGSLFSAYTQTTLTMHQNDDPQLYGTNVFLVFDDMNAVLQISNSGDDFQYLYAPVGLSCTAVALGVKDSILFASFVPVTIATNQTVPFTMSPVADDFLKGQLQILD